MVESMQRAQQPGTADASFLVTALSTVALDLQIPSIYLALVKAAAQLMGADSAVFYISEGSTARAVAILESGQAAQLDAPGRAMPAQDALFRAVQDAVGPKLIVDVAADSPQPGLVQARPGAEAPATICVAPLRTADRLLGFLELDYGTVITLDEASKNILQQFADLAARQVMHALLLEERSVQADFAQVRVTIATAMRAQRDQNAALQGLADELGADLGVTRCVVQAGRRSRRVRHAYEAEPCYAARQMDAALQAIEVSVAERGSTVAANDLCVTEALDPVLLSHREALLAAHVRALVVTPLVTSGETLGTLALLEVDRARSWRGAEIVLVEQVARDSAAVLLHAQTAAEEERQVAVLRRERDLLRAAIDHLPVGVVIAETPDDMVLWNRSAQTLAVSGGTHALEDDDQPVFDAVLADGKAVPPDERLLVRAFREEAAITTQEISMRQRDGRLVPTTISATPLYDVQGQLAGMLATLQDISALRQAEARAGNYQAWFQVTQRVAGPLSSLPLSDLGKAIGAAVATIAPFDLLTIAVAGSEGEESIERIAQWSPRPDLDLNRPFEGALLQRLRQERAALVIDDLRDAGQVDGLEMARQDGIRSCLALPIGDGQELLGAIVLYSKQQDRYRDVEFAPLAAVAAMLTLALRTDRQVRQARDLAIREERERLAREIHDTLAQSITGVVMQLDSVMLATPADAPHRSRLDQARQMAREGLAQTRRSVWNLKPASAKQNVPRTILQDEIAMLERRMGIQPDVTTSGEERDVAPEVGAVLQRLIRVALENTWMHSEADQVRIVLDYGLQSLTLLIEDDGQGFDPDTVKLRGEGRSGLAGVAERARLIGGTVRIKSAVGHGTQVQAELPYLPAEPAPVVVPPIPAPAIEAAPAAGIPQHGGTDRIKVFLIDDHAMVREGLERMLQDQDDLQVIGAAANGTEGLRRIAELQPDVVLCDLQLPDMSGVDVISRIHTHFKDIRCVVVTTYADEDSIHEGFKAGAKGYVLKDVSATELANAVRAAARDESLLQPIVARKLVEGFTELARQGGMVEALTEREVEVLKALASGARNKEIAFDLGLSESTIKTHLASIFGKLNVTTRTEAVARGRDLGLISL